VPFRNVTFRHGDDESELEEAVAEPWVETLPTSE
jgi:hypothetical protein